MGNGASGHVKSIKIKQHRSGDGELTRDRRSNSDGCIIDSLNSSKSKVDILRQQLQECQEELKEAEERAGKAQLLEQQMAEVEGNNFELSDRVAALEHELEILKREKEELDDEDFTETLNAKDQYIEKLQKEAEDMQTEMKKLRIRMKKKLKGVQTELAEAKQESALKVYSFKQDISRLEEENAKLTQHLDRASSASKSRQAAREKKKIPDSDSEPEYEDSRTKLILELSNQVSVQDEKINELESELAAKERLIQELQKLQPRPPSGTRKGSAGRHSKDIRLADVTWPGSGDTYPNKVRVSSGGSRHGAVPKDDITPDLDSGVVVEEANKSTMQTSSRQSSSTSRSTSDSDVRDTGGSASRRRRREQVRDGNDNSDQSPLTHESKDTKSGYQYENSPRHANSYTHHALSDSHDVKEDPDTFRKQDSLGVRRKTRTDFSEKNSKDSRTTERTKQTPVGLATKSQLTSHFTDVYDLNDLLNDFDSFDAESETLVMKKKMKKSKHLSSKEHDSMYFDTDKALSEIPVP